LSPFAGLEPFLLLDSRKRVSPFLPSSASNPVALIGSRLRSYIFVGLTVHVRSLLRWQQSWLHEQLLFLETSFSSFQFLAPLFKGQMEVHSLVFSPAIAFPPSCILHPRTPLPSFLRAVVETSCAKVDPASFCLSFVFFPICFSLEFFPTPTESCPHPLPPLPTLSLWYFCPLVSIGFFLSADQDNVFPPNFPNEFPPSSSLFSIAVQTLPLFSFPSSE